MKRLAQDWGWILSGLAMALVGGLGRALKCSRSDFTWMGFAFRILTAVFVSILVSFVMLEASYPPAIESAIIGLSGYLATDILEGFREIVRRKSGSV